MSHSVSYILQIGTQWDGGQNLIWAPLANQVLDTQQLIVPKPRRYRPALTRMTNQEPDPGEGHAYFSEQIDPSILENGPASVLLGLTSLMQPVPYFCPAGDWFWGLGERIQEVRKLFEPCPVFVMMSPQNPATLLSLAWSSGRYRGFEDIPPDPFALRWTDVIQEIKSHNPDLEILICQSETGPVTWPLALQALTGLSDAETKALQYAITLQSLEGEGTDRLTAFMEEKGDMPLKLHGRAIASFFKAYGSPKTPASENAIPGWTSGHDQQIDALYEEDLQELQTMEGVYFWGLSG